MRRYVRALMALVMIVGLWAVVGPNSLVDAQSDCVSQGAVSPSETALAADCEVLLDIRDTLAGTAALNWAADVPIEDWKGINVTGMPMRVTEVAGAGLNGTIPGEIGELDGLQGLDLRSNRLTGSIPTELGDLSSLTALHLGDNHLTGTIPPQLGDLTKLAYVNLYNNRLLGQIPTELGNLVNLEHLYLSGNQLTGCIPVALRSVVNNDFEQVDLPFCVMTTLNSGTDPPGYQVRIDSPILVLVTFSEPVYGFTESDIAVANGSADNFTGSDGDSVYTFDVTPNAIGVVTVDIAAGVATDSDGEANTAAVQLTLGLPYDDDHDGAISRDEVITAIADHLFGGLLTRDEVIQIVALHLFG